MRREQIHTTPYPGETLEQWVGRIYAQARLTHPRRTGRGRPGRRPEMVACGLIMRTLRETCRGMVERFERSPELRGLVGLSSTPSRMWFCRANFVTENAVMA